MLTAPKRQRRRKLKSKRSFGSASSGTSNLPSNMKPSLPELFALHALKQKPNEGERPCDVARNAREAATSKPYVKGELLTTPRTTSTSDSREPSDRKQCEASASEIVENQTSFIEEEQVIVCEKPGRKALTESNVEDIVKQLREFLLENSPSQKHDLLKALSPSKAFLDWHLGSRVLHEHLYSFIYYQHSNDQDDECDCPSLVHDGASTGSCLTSTIDTGRQYAVARDDESRSARVISPSSSCYGATMECDDKEEKRRMKNRWTQVPSLPRCESRALQVVQKTCGAEALTHGWDPARFPELQSKLDNFSRRGLRALQESHAREAQQLRFKIDKLRKVTPQAPPLNAAEVTKNHPAMNELRPTGTNGARAQVIPPPPRPPLRQRSPTPRPKPLGEAARASHWRKAPSSATSSAPTSAPSRQEVQQVRTNLLHQMRVTRDDVAHDVLLPQTCATVTNYGKDYDSDTEEYYRLKIYMENRMKIARHNEKYAKNQVSYKLAMNEFGDLLHHEFVSTRNGFKRNYRDTPREGSFFLEPEGVEDVHLPKAIDWRKKGAVTPIKNQGQCGSCWAFSTTGSLEGQHFRKTGKLVSLSEQNLVDCSTSFGNNGCEGGLMDNAFKYIKANKGIDTEMIYPYNGTDGVCHFVKSGVGATDSGFVDIPEGKEDKLKKAVATVGPVSVAIDASHQSFQFYSEGIYDEPECSSEQLDHGVLVVGYGTKDGQDYWLVKNSWGTTWGDEGYIYMTRNKNNQCGIASSASYPLV
ncbi:hypothetical protein HPB49_016579 [Dermacentor silvarum]|uniref:Uncharacterized protein n=1 Tax=Dermacentor silvarum TaxID=543639 RepID=A0ACB8CA56_DERSI|nr:hypothetical protein HPB49_016579 [Dermacentor silvarum]